MYIKDCLTGSQPDVGRALDYLAYLHDLLDEIPLLTWEVVRDAHSEVLRLVEQGRLIWTDTVARSVSLSKALRRAKFNKDEADRLAAEKAVGARKGSSSSEASDKKPCPKFQTQTCEEPGNHVDGGITLLHCCSTCYRTKKQRYGHSREVCQRQQKLDEKSKGTKN